MRRARAAGVDLSAHLADNSSHAALEALGDLLVTGPTNTNLLDLYLIVVLDGPSPYCLP